MSRGPSERSPFLSARALGLALVALALMAVMVVLGLWQLGVYDDHQHDDAQARLSREPVPLGEVLGPDDAFPSDGIARPVLVRGEYVGADSFEVRDSDTLGVTSAVVTPLRVDDGSVVLVVRGAGGLGAPRPPAEHIEVTGVLEPADSTGSSLSPDRVTDGIRTAALVQDFERDLYAGYVVLTDSVPPDQVAPIDPPTPDASWSAGVRNLVYALQWWLFAGFVAFMWWRVVVETPNGVPDDESGHSGVEESAAETPRSVG